MNVPTRVLKTGMTGSDVAAMHVGLRQLGFTIPDEEARAMKYGRGTHHAVAQFQALRGLQPTGTIDASTASEIVAAVAEATHVVRGSVLSPVSASVGTLDVRIVDKNVGGDVLLVETITDARGAYSTTAIIPLDALLKRHKTRPDLQARISRGDKLLAVSAVAYDAPPNVTLDVELPPDAVLASEYETLTANLAGAFGGPLADLEENDRRQDITYLARKTGSDARAVAMLA